MLQGILGKKIGMSRWFSPEGDALAVTLISCDSCYVVEKKDGRLQIGFEEVKEKALSKPELGYLKKRNLPPLKNLKEVMWNGKTEEMPEVGEKINADIFQAGEKVDIQAKTKGKGFTGVVKRWGFSGGAATRGSRSHRAPGSIGASAYPSRVWPGKKMAGRKGGDRVTIMNMEVVNVDPVENIIAVKGAVPGPNKGIVFVRRTVKK